MRVGTYPTRGYATLGPLELRPPFTGASDQSFGVTPELLPLTFRHWAGVGPYTSAYALAQTCVFVKQSPELLRCGPPELAPRRAPLIPKLRGSFA